LNSNYQRNEEDAEEDMEEDAYIEDVKMIEDDVEFTEVELTEDVEVEEPVLDLDEEEDPER